MRRSLMETRNRQNDMKKITTDPRSRLFWKGIDANTIANSRNMKANRTRPARCTGFAVGLPFQRNSSTLFPPLRVLPENCSLLRFDILADPIQITFDLHGAKFSRGGLTRSSLDQLHSPKIVQMHDAFYISACVYDDQRGDLALFKDCQCGRRKLVC